MRWGMGWSCFWGDPEAELIIIRDTDLGSGIARTFMPVAGRSQYYQLVIDGKASGMPVFVRAGQIQTLRGNWDLPQGPHLVSIVGVGPWSVPNFFDITPVQTAFAAVRANRLHFEIVSTPRQFSKLDTGGTGGLTNWAVTGMIRFQNCGAAANRPTWGVLDLVLSTAGPIHTLTASLKGTTIFSGSRNGNGSITLYDADSVQVGTVDLAYSADFASGGLFVTSWPKAYYLYYKLNNNWVGGDFPAYSNQTVVNATWAAGVATLVTAAPHGWTVGTSITIADIIPSGFNTGTSAVLITAVTATHISFALAIDPGAYVSGGTITRVPQAIIYDDGKSATYSFNSPPTLPVGTYHVIVHEISDTGEESIGTANLTQDIVTPPAAIGELIYISGDWSNTVIQWEGITASSYNIYDSLDLGVINVTPIQTRANGLGSLQKQLTAISNTFTGTRWVFVRTVLAGVESGNSVAIPIVYNNGAVVLNRPNVPQMGRITISGDTLTVKWSYDSLNSFVTATEVQLFIADTPNGFNYGAPDGTVVISGTDRITFGEISGTVLADGEYWFTLRANSANGLSLNTNIAGPVTLSTSVPADPVFTVRGGI